MSMHVMTVYTMYLALVWHSRHNQIHSNFFRIIVYKEIIIAKYFTLIIII